jgi:2-iminobutanoate/2-iminopropanoate deaminase
MKEVINPGTPVAGPYSPGIKIGKNLYISGQGWSQESSDISDQTYQTLNQIKKIVVAAGGNISNIVNIVVYLRNMEDFKIMNKTYRKFFEDNGVNEGFPARSTIEVSNLPLASMLIEINALAVLE